MSQALIEELKQENLCTHFILPLIKLNKFSFTSSGYLNTYLTVDKQRIAVQISDTTLLSRRVYVHPEFVAVYKQNSGLYLVMFRLRNRWQRDVELFCMGKYSQLSTSAKDHIIRYSGLPYYRKDGTKVKTDGRLLALEKHKILKGMWEKEMFTVSGKDIDDPETHLPDEYLSIPGKETFINPTGLMRIRETQL